MRRPYARLVAACACAVATAVFTSVALADPGNGNSANAPGQVKQEQPTAQQPAVQPTAQQPAAQSQAPGQEKKAAQSQPQTQSQSPGQAKQAAKASSTSAGVKPANNTTHWTHCTTGTSSSGATCTSSDNGHTPQGKADVSKQYGNGKTAAQIAVSRGGVNVQLTGPGNSQPHKVTACGKPSNKSGGVDVHAIKSYDASACQSKVQTPTVPAPAATPPVAPCGFTVVQQQALLGMMHVNGKGEDVHLMTNPHSAHFQGKHEDDHPVYGTVSSLQADTSQNCGAQPQPTPPVVPVVPVTPVTPSTATPQTPAAPATGALPATQGQPTAAAPAASGGVLGAQTSLASPKPASHGGVLGTVTKVAGASLPFTGFPVWAAMLVALALVAGGIFLRRRGASARL